MKKIILIGAGGHCKACIDVIEKNNEYKIFGLIDNDKKKGIFNYKILGSDKILSKLSKRIKYAFITIGQITNFEIRERIFRDLKKKGFKLPKIISPLSYISKHAKIGEGTIVMHNSIINAGANIGKNCIINSMSLIEHDVKIGDHCHISTKAVLNGSVKVGKFSFIGSNATLKHGIRVGEKSIINSKKLVSKDVKKNTILR